MAVGSEARSVEKPAGVANTTVRTERLAAIVDRALDAIIIAAPDGRLLSVNDAASKISGYSRDELLAMTIWDLIAPGDLALAAHELTERLRGGPRRTVSLGLVAKNRGLIHVEATGQITWADGEPESIELIVRDMTERHELEEQLVRQATHDALTGLPNRVLFLDRLEQALKQAERDGAHVAVGILDLDNFKLVNDALGHEVGDRLLAELAPRLEAALRSSDTVARLGGDEFAILFAGAGGGSEEAVVAVARRLLAVFDGGFAGVGREQMLGGSLGIAMALPGQSTTQVLRDADVAMYHAKSAGRGRYELYDAEMRSELERRLNLQNATAHAVEEHEVRVVYQPIYDLDTGVLLGAEALARWLQPDGELRPAAEFIEAVEEFGLTRRLAEQVVGQVIALLARRDGRNGCDLPWGISVNLTGHELGDPDFVTWLLDELHDGKIPAGALTVELTERVLVDYERRCAGNLARLHEAGVRLSLDDFGTGYSGLASLLNGQFATVKIDRMFVEQLPSPAASALVTATTTLAHAIEVDVIAEGIETDSQRDELRLAGCDAGQGHLLARPMPEAEFEALLAGVGRAPFRPRSARNGSPRSPRSPREPARTS